LCDIKVPSETTKFYLISHVRSFRRI
jgi:hypothetical protein